MLVENNTAQDEALLSYMVGSGDMRFIENGERALFLRYDPAVGQIIRGELRECGPLCDVNLSGVLLEYVMGCEDCRGAKRTAEAADRFGRQLARRFIDLRYQEPAETFGIATLTDAVTIVLHSMDASFEVDQSGSVLRFTLDDCPLHATARQSGLNLWVALAHRAFIALIDTLLQELAPGWVRQWPVERESDAPLRELRFAKI
ncbi:MAG: hypothetical protein HF973_07290 [Chloroflexi bacterium]|nr:hypothetical protein [Chloroflexota bacterium]